MQNKPIIETWFPKTLYIVNDFHLKQLQIYRQECLRVIKKQSSRTSLKNVDSSHGFLKNDLSKNPVFKNLVKDILFHCNQYMKSIGYDFDIEIDSMWANLSKKGDYLFPHNHPSSLVSGAFYVSANHQDDIIKFFDNINDMLLPVEKSKLNVLSYDNCSHQCVPGKLIIFRSNFLHGCPALQGDEKIVISFNIKAK